MLIVLPSLAFREPPSNRTTPVPLTVTGPTSSTPARLSDPPPLSVTPSACEAPVTAPWTDRMPRPELELAPIDHVWSALRPIGVSQYDVPMTPVLVVVIPPEPSVIPLPCTK